MSDQALKQAIALIRVGRTEPARQILSQLLKQEPEHEQAWLWISKCFNEPERKKYCFERVLKANPENPVARRALQGLQLKSTTESLESLRRAAQPAVQQAVKHKGKKRSGALNFLLGLLVVAVVAAAVWAGLNYLLPHNIPLTHAQLKSHLTAIGVFCSSVERTEHSTSYDYVMRCSGYTNNGRVQVALDVYSERDPQKISLILAYVTQVSGQPSADGMGETLAHVAAFPYQNASPSEASAWVQRNFPLLLSAAPGEDPVAQFGRVRFHLASLGPTRKYLAIGEGQ